MTISTFYFYGEGPLTEVFPAELKAVGLREARDVKAADVVFTYFWDETRVEDVYFDSEGLVQLLNPGTYLVDFSPVSPYFTHELFAVSAVSDLHFAAAPMAVLDPTSPEPFKPENLVFFLGGESADVAAVSPFVAALGDVRVVGQAADAQLTRAAHTISQTAGLLAAVETEALYRAVRESALDISPDLEAARQVLPPDNLREAALTAVLERQFTGAYAVPMFLGEMRAAITAADDAEIILPQLEAALGLAELLDVVGREDHAPAALSLLFADKEEGNRNGLDWGRAQELLAQHGENFDDDDDDDECGCGCGHHHHDYGEEMTSMDAIAEFSGLRGHGFAPEYDDDDLARAPYGFDRFDADEPLGEDDDDDYPEN